MVSAASMFRKSGFNDQDSATLASVAAQFQNVADTAISAEDAAGSIVSQIRAFGEDAGFAQTVVDAYNEVANSFSVGTNDLSKAMEVASAGLATYNNSFEEILGLVTAGSEVMVGRSAQVARGLSTIASNTAKAGDELAKYGITVYDAEGNFRSTYDILKDLSKIWGTMSDVERQALGETLSGGVNQYKVLAAIMGNFTTAIDATKTAYESAGSAAEENSRYMESLEAKTTALKATFEDFSNNVINSDFVGRLLDVANGFLKLANTDLGRFVTQVGLISGVGLGLSQLVKISNIGSLIKQFSTFVTIISQITNPAVVSAVGGLGSAISGAVTAAGGFSAIALPTIAAVAAAVIGLVEVIKLIKGAVDEANKSIEELNEEYKQTQDEIDATTTKLDEYKQKLQELEETPDDNRGKAWREERDEIELNIKAAEQYLEILERAAKQQGERLLQGKSVTGYSVKQSNLQTQYLPDGTTYQTTSQGFYLNAEQVKVLTAQYGSLKEAYLAATDALEEYLPNIDWVALSTMDEADQLDYLQTELASIGVWFGEVKETQEEAATTMAELANKTGELTQAEKELAQQKLDTWKYAVQQEGANKETISSYINLAAKLQGLDLATADANEKLVFLGNTLGRTKEEAIEFGVQNGYLSTSSYNAYNNVVKLANGTLALKSNCEKAKDGTWQLKEAVEELATASVTGNDKAYNLAEQLLAQAKQANSTKASINDLVAQEIIFSNTGYSVEHKIAALQALALQAGVTQSAIDSMNSSFLYETARSQNYQDLLKHAQTEMGLNKKEAVAWATSQTKKSTTTLTDYYAQLQKLMDEAGKSAGSGGVSSSGGGGGSSKTKSAAEKAAEEAAAAAKQAWENQKQKELWELEQQEAAIKKQADDAKAEVDDYKNQLTAISKAQKEQTEAIKKELEAQLKVIQAQKDVLESQKDALDVRADDLDRLIDYNQEYADKQIENLEAEKDAIQETIDAINEKYDKQIEALETTNKELDKEIEREKLLKALADARAKKTLVFKNGRFTYEQDIEAVSKAQADLDKFDREQQIEKEKELIEENRKNELQYSKDEQAALDAEIERWKKYKDGWANLVSDYNYQQNALLAAQKYGLNLENQTWTQRLNNVSRFAKDYANIMTEQKQVQSQLTALQEEQARLQEIASARQEEVAARMQEQYDRINALMEQAQTRYNQYQEQLKNIQQNISDTNNKQYTDLPRVLKSVNGQAPSDAKVGDYIVTGGGIFQIIGGYPGAWQSNKITATKFADVGSAKNWLSSQGYQFQYARGTTSAHNGISLVGEQGPELRVTKSGDGILPAAITQNLWSWGKLDPDKVLGGVMHNLGNLVFNNANLSFPNIRSGSDARLFVENLKNLAYQYAFAR